jgi:hypothetical protein
VTELSDEEFDALWESGAAIDEALRQSVIDAARRHQAAGIPMVILRDGEVVHVPAEEVLAEIGAATPAMAPKPKKNGARR